MNRFNVIEDEIADTSDPSERELNFNVDLGIDDDDWRYYSDADLEEDDSDIEDDFNNTLAGWM